MDSNGKFGMLRYLGDPLDKITYQKSQNSRCFKTRVIHHPLPPKKRKKKKKIAIDHEVSDVNIS